MKPAFLPENAKKRWPLLCMMTIFILICSVLLCFVENPLEENLTGLGYVRHYFWSMMLYTLMISSYSVYLSWLLFDRYPLPRTKFYRLCLLLGWVSMCVGVIIPWHEKTGSAQLDLHSLLCTAASVFMILVWLKLLVDPYAYGGLRKIVIGELFAILAGIVLLAMSGCVSLICEVGYICLHLVVLTYAQYPG